MGFAAGIFLTALACSRSDVPPPTESEGAPRAPAAATGSAGGGPASLPLQEPTATLAPAREPTATPATPEAPISPTPPPTPTLQATDLGEVLYYAQPGDTLQNLAVRFGVVPEDIQFAEGSRPGAAQLIDIDRLMVIPRRLGATGPSDLLIPDSELVFSPHAADLDVSAFVAAQGGFLNAYREYVGNRWRSGAEVVALAARDHSFNPRLLLAILEYHAGWVTDPTRPTGDDFRFPLGNRDPQWQGLFRQLTWLANELGDGYYGWRAGSLTELVLEDGSILRLSPELNAGSVALQYYFSRFLPGRQWAEALGPEGLLATYQDLFGDPWSYFHPLYEPGVQQPDLILPFLEGHVWAFTGGPHGAWEREAAWAALDFAPSSMETGCKVSTDWAVAAAPGLVIRTGTGLVVLDLDGDGREQTGWTLLYLHVANQGRVPAGAFVEQGDLIGHPSCEGGVATGAHIHLARKYNGEWVLADGPLPFELSGWVARAGAKAYQGALVRGEDTVLACPCSSQETWISR